MSAHTPGPWKYRELSGDVLAGTETVCTMPVLEAETSREQEVLANARLIAAAPDLLVALENIAAAEDLANYAGGKLFPVRVSKLIRAALAKGRGTK